MATAPINGIQDSGELADDGNYIYTNSAEVRFGRDAVTGAVNTMHIRQYGHDYTKTFTYNAGGFCTLISLWVKQA